MISPSWTCPLRSTFPSSLSWSELSDPPGDPRSCPSMPLLHLVGERESMVSRASGCRGFPITSRGASPRSSSTISSARQVARHCLPDPLYAGASVLRPGPRRGVRNGHLVVLGARRLGRSIGVDGRCSGSGQCSARPRIVQFRGQFMPGPRLLLGARFGDKLRVRARVGNLRRGELSSRLSRFSEFDVPFQCPHSRSLQTLRVCCTDR